MVFIVFCHFKIIFSPCFKILILNSHLMHQCSVFLNTLLHIFQTQKYPLAYFIEKHSMALFQVFRGMNVIIFSCCAVPKGNRHKGRLTDVNWITLLLSTQSNLRSVAGAKEIDIAATLEHLRDQRAGMVQTKVRSLDGSELERGERTEQHKSRMKITR